MTDTPTLSSKEWFVYSWRSVGDVWHGGALDVPTFVNPFV
jgi:hypothetical protein